MKRVSLKTIASELGVSSATVSLVLSGKNENGRVSKEMSKKILDKAEELNYIPNSLAKSLKVGKSKTIGLIIADISNIFFGALALHIQKLAEEAGYTVIIGNTNEQLGEMEKLIKFLYARQVDGFIITPTENSQHLIKRLMSIKIPFVLVDRSFPELSVNSVLINNYDISYKATEYLINKGCINIGLITYKQNHYHINERKRGCIDALINAGLFNQENIKEVRYDSLISDIDNAIKCFLNCKKKIDGYLFTTNTISIIGAKALISNNIQIQEDIQIMCFDENDAFYLLPYSIPFIKQPIKLIAGKAIELLIRQFENLDTEVENCVLDAQLVLNDFVTLKN